jgi:FMN-dependent oxidoreductase (nitrilotriacetate monooxygenase family)
MTDRRMTLVGFVSASTTQASIGAWTHPSTDTRIFDPDYYVGIARTLERGGFDLMFIDDRLAMPMAYGHDHVEAVRRGSRVIKLDPLTIMGVLAGATSRIGLGATYSTTYYAPYHVARAFATLDYMSHGRAVWNIVTSLNSDEAENFGAEYQDPDARYNRADEFLEIVTGLWESWAPDAVLLDRESRTFGDPTKVRELNYRGKFLSSRGPLTVPRPPQDWPLLLQAGQSGRGQQFAARWADLIFTAPIDLDGGRKHYAAHQEALGGYGRTGGSARILPAILPMVGETEEIARAKEALYDGLTDPGEALVFLSEMANVDLSAFPQDQPNLDEVLTAVTGTKGVLDRAVTKTKAMYGQDATVRDMATMQSRGGTYRIVGSPTQVADELEEWFTTGACDGFVVLPTDVPGGFEDFARLVVPELRRRGLVGEESTETGPLRQRLGFPTRSQKR